MKTPLPLARLLSCAALSIALVLSVTGCALTKDHISINYSPQTNVIKVAGAELVAAAVQVSDLRAAKDRVGSKKNGYGMEMAAIVANEDITDTVRNAVEAELKQRGFTVGPGDLLLSIQVIRFQNDFKVGFWAGDAIAELMLETQLRKSDGAIVYSKVISGDGAKMNIQLASGSNAKVALEGALRSAMERLFGDPVFIDALLKSSKRSP
jgi:uncharacterized lipoprotein